MTKVFHPSASAAAQSGAQTQVVVDRPALGEVQSTDGMLDPMKREGFFVLPDHVDIDHYIGERAVESARHERMHERKIFPLPSTRGPIKSPFGSEKIVEQELMPKERLSDTQIYFILQERMADARRWHDLGGKMLPSYLQDRMIGAGGVSKIYPGHEGRVLKFVHGTISAERLHVIHSALHMFGISHLEIRTDHIALTVGRIHGIVEQMELPEGSIQLRKMTGDHGKLNKEALRMVCDKVGVEARQELEELDQQVQELNADMLLHNEAYFRKYSVLDMLETRRIGRYVSFVCDAFRSGGWNLNVFFNPDPSMRWFLIDW